MMEYSVSMENVTITTPAGNMPHVFLNPAAAPKPNIQIIRAWMSQSSTATSAQLNLAHRYQATAFPSTGTSTTPTPLKGGAAGTASNITGGTSGAAGTVGVNYGTLGAGTKTLILADNFNNLNGYLWVATPKETIDLNSGSATGYGLYLITTPSALTGFSAGIVYAEV